MTLDYQWICIIFHLSANDVMYSYVLRAYCNFGALCILIRIPWNFDELGASTCLVQIIISMIPCYLWVHFFCHQVAGRKNNAIMLQMLMELKTTFNPEKISHESIHFWCQRVIKNVITSCSFLLAKFGLEQRLACPANLQWALTNPCWFKASFYYQRWFGQVYWEANGFLSPMKSVYYI